MKRWATVCVLLSIALIACYGLQADAPSAPLLQAELSAAIPLPPPRARSAVTVEEAIARRRSVRECAPEPLSVRQVSQLLWAAQGITDPDTGKRAAPSAQRTYPLRVYLIAGAVRGLVPGAYRYVPHGHALELVAEGDLRPDATGQEPARKAPALLIYTADWSATAQKFGDSLASRWAFIEVGHSAQNVLLEQVALGLVGVGAAGIDVDGLRAALRLPEKEEPVYMVVAGRPIP